MNEKYSKNKYLSFIIPAAGKSTRFNQKNKIFEKIDYDNNFDVLQSVIYLAISIGIVKKVIVGYNKNSKQSKDSVRAHSLDPSDEITNEELINNLKKVDFVEGGSSRQETVFNCLKYLKNQNKDIGDDWVIIHDAARPCLLVYDILEFINKTLDHNISSIMALPLVDTLKKVNEDKIIEETIPRENLWVAQTPQMFKFNVVFSSLKYCIENKLQITDESQAIELNGHKCRVHYGRPYNIKITHEMDMTVAKCIINHIERYILEDVEFNTNEDQI